MKTRLLLATAILALIATLPVLAQSSSALTTMTTVTG